MFNKKKNITKTLHGTFLFETNVYKKYFFSNSKKILKKFDSIKFYICKQNQKNEFICIFCI